MGRVVALVAARDEEATIEATVAGLRGLAVDEVVVVDDGSRDRTAAAARSAGATVAPNDGRRGKGGALEAGLVVAGEADVYLFADGDLGSSASSLGPVLDGVLLGRADVCVGVIPKAGGGFGIVKGFSRRVILALSGFVAREPLSGQRALSHEALQACRPLARGFGVETAMTIDAVRLGFAVAEVDVDLRHRATGRDVAGFIHRGRQGWDILRAVIPRAVGLR